MWSERSRLLLTTVVAVFLVGATVAVYLIDAGPSSEQPSEAISGETVFLTKGCTSCHSIAGVSSTAQIGPDLTAVASRAGDRVEGLTAEDYVRQSVLDPQAFIVDGYGPLMPTLPLDVAELDALVGFLLTER